MPKLTGNKDEIQGQSLLPEGLYTVRMDGFKPRLSNKKDTVNLCPQLKVINHPEHNDRFAAWENLNSNAKFMWPDFCHAFGVPIPETPDGGIEFPGDFIGPDDISKCAEWQYTGPLLGQTGQVYVIQGDNGKGGKSNKIRFYVCKIPGCTHNHSKNLN